MLVCSEELCQGNAILLHVVSCVVISHGRHWKHWLELSFLFGTFPLKKYSVVRYTILRKANSRLYILRICKFYGYSQSELTTLYDSLIVSVFSYGVEVWGAAFHSKYLSQIDRFNKRAYKYGYTSKHILISDIISKRDNNLWDAIVNNHDNILRDLLPPIRKRQGLRNKGHNFLLPKVTTERFKRSFVNRCLFNIV